jgi:hypothetical protein
MDSFGRFLQIAPHAVKEAGQQLGGISPTTFYALVMEGQLSLVIRRERHLRR